MNNVYNPQNPITPTNFPVGFRFPPKIFKDLKASRTPKKAGQDEEECESPLVLTSIYDLFSE